jgi:hypothetical protein
MRRADLAQLPIHESVAAAAILQCHQVSLALREI